MSNPLLDVIYRVSKELNSFDFKERRFVIKTLKEWNELLHKRERNIAMARFEFCELVERLDIKYDKKS